MTNCVVLLRAVTVGGRTLSMDRFRQALTAIGCPMVTTLGTTGNAVVHRPRAACNGAFERLIELALASRAGVPTAAFVRDPQEWDQIVRGNPFPSEAREDPAHLVLTVLKSTPPAGVWRTLSDGIVGREVVRSGGRHAYIVYPDGIGRSKLTATRIERLLGVGGTSRNWNTVLRLRGELERLAGSTSRPLDRQKRI